MMPVTEIHAAPSVQASPEVISAQTERAVKKAENKMKAGISGKKKKSHEKRRKRKQAQKKKKAVLKKLPIKGIMKLKKRTAETVFPQRLSYAIYGKSAQFKENINWALWKGLSDGSAEIDISSLHFPLSELPSKGAYITNAISYYQMVNPDRYYYNNGMNATVSYDDTLPSEKQELTILYPHAQHLDDGAFNDAVSRICAKASRKKTDAEKIKSVNSQICRMTEYGEGEHSSDAYGALVNHKAVCFGYAQAFHLCMNRLNIPDKYEFSKSGDHVWNRVNVKGKWKVVDVTWNDVTDNQYLLTKAHKASVSITK